MSTMDKQILKALFAQQRVQIMDLRLADSPLISDSYAYAWQAGVYPIGHDTDDSVPWLPHQSFEDVSKDYIEKVSIYLDDLWIASNSPTFDDMELHFGGKAERVKLTSVCRYFYLCGDFNNKLWDALLTPNCHPAGVQIFKTKFTTQYFDL